MRAAQSAWGFITAAETEHAVAALRAELDSGEWDAKYGQLRTQPSYAGSLRLITAAG